MEALLETIHAAARETVAAMGADELRPALLGLSLEAARQLDGPRLRVKLSPRDHASCGADLGRSLAGLLDRPCADIEVVAVASQLDPGPVVEDQVGRQVWDNRLLARLERLWPALRRELAAKLFAQPTGAAP
jgi:vacuolar-type H+-ATPase subunit E/Vma4